MYARVHVHANYFHAQHTMHCQEQYAFRALRNLAETRIILHCDAAYARRATRDSAPRYAYRHINLNKTHTNMKCIDQIYVPDAHHRCRRFLLRRLH